MTRATYYFLNQKQDPENMATVLLDVDGWGKKKDCLVEYLRGDLELEELKEDAGLYPGSQMPVSDSQFRKELENLDLLEFMALIQ